MEALVQTSLGDKQCVDILLSTFRPLLSTIRTAILSSIDHDEQLTESALFIVAKRLLEARTEALIMLDVLC
jgi:hypothetical protein